MNKSTLVEFVATNANLKKKDAEAAVNAMFKAIESELATGGKVQIAGFGNFKMKERKWRWLAMVSMIVQLWHKPTSVLPWGMEAILLWIPRW